MPRFSQRIRKTRKHRQHRKATRRVHRKQRGGLANMPVNMPEPGLGLKEQLINLIINHQDYNDVLGFVQNQIEQPIIHPNFPIDGNNGQYTMMIYGDPHSDIEQTTMLIIHIKKNGGEFTEVGFEALQGEVRTYLEQKGNPELMPMNETHSAIEQAVSETLIYM
jgi:hypothetical protein